MRKFSSGTLPSGLSQITQYFVNVVSASRITLSTTQGGAAINWGISSAGTGTFLNKHLAVIPCP